MLHVTHFDTEDGWDFLTIGGIEYSGFSGSEGVFIELGDILLWHSDSFINASGFVVCLMSSGSAFLASNNVTSSSNHTTSLLDNSSVPT